MTSIAPPSLRLLNTAQWGVWLSACVALLLSAVIGYFLWLALSDPDGAARLLVDQLDLNGHAPLLSRTQALLAAGLWLLTDLLALAMLVQSCALFAGIRANGMFTLQTASRLRRIGWLVFALGPASVVVNALTSILINHWRTPGGLHGDLSIEDVDFYAMVVGLVIVAVGHIMVEATRIDTENKAFV